MTTDMPEEIWVGNRKGLYCTINEIPSAPDVAKYTRTDKHEELKAIAESMAVAVAEICRGSCYDIHWQSDGKDYDVASKALSEYNKFKGVG
jgi:hypothetical protein